MTAFGKSRRSVSVLERVKGIEPSFSAWEANVLPLNDTRTHGARITDFRSLSYQLNGRQLADSDHGPAPIVHSGGELAAEDFTSANNPSAGGLLINLESSSMELPPWSSIVSC